MDRFEPKLIYLTRRHSQLTREGFRTRWRQHASLGMSLPRWSNIARYVHCDLERPEEGVHSNITDHDGIGFIWHRSPSHRAAHLGDTASKALMEADEAATFARPIVRDCLVAREEMIVRPQEGANWKLVRFASEPAAIDFPSGATGHVRNHPLAPENGCSWGLDVTTIDEFWFPDKTAAVHAITDLQGKGLVALGRDVQLYP